MIWLFVACVLLAWVGVLSLVLLADYWLCVALGIDLDGVGGALVYGVLFDAALFPLWKGHEWVEGLLTRSPRRPLPPRKEDPPPPNTSDWRCGYCGKPPPFPCWNRGVCVGCATGVRDAFREGVPLAWGVRHRD